MTRPVWVWNWGLIFSRSQSRRCPRPQSHLRWRNRHVLGETLEQRQLLAVDFCEPAIVVASIQTNGTSNNASAAIKTKSDRPLFVLPIEVRSLVRSLLNKSLGIV